MTHNYCLGNKYLVWFTALCTTTVQINLVNAKMNGLTVPSPWFTGKSLSEALIFESTNPQYDNRLFIALQVKYMKIPSSKLGRTCCVQKFFLTFRTIFVQNMFSPCWIITFLHDELSEPFSNDASEANICSSKLQLTFGSHDLSQAERKMTCYVTFWPNWANAQNNNYFY